MSALENRRTPSSLRDFNSQALYRGSDSAAEDVTHIKFMNESRSPSKFDGDRRFIHRSAQVLLGCGFHVRIKFQFRNRFVELLLRFLAPCFKVRNLLDR